MSLKTYMFTRCIYFILFKINMFHNSAACVVSQNFSWFTFAMWMAREPYDLVHGPWTLRPCPWPVNPTTMSDYSCYSASCRVRFTSLKCHFRFISHALNWTKSCELCSMPLQSVVIRFLNQNVFVCGFVREDVNNTNLCNGGWQWEP